MCTRRNKITSMKRGVLLGLVLILLVALVPTSSAVEYVKISGVVQKDSMDRGTTYVNFWLKGQFGGAILAGTQVQSNGSYSVLVPKNTPLEIALMSYESNGSFAGWTRSASYEQDTVLNFKVPLGLKISGRVVDAQGRSLGGAAVVLDDFNDLMDPLQVSNDGTLWRGYRQSQSDKADSTGSFVLYSYSTKEVGSKRTLNVRGLEAPGYSWLSPKFIVDGPKEFVVCIPINFGPTLSLPSYCSEDVVAKAAADGQAARDLAAVIAAAEAAAAIAKAAADAKLATEARRKEQVIKVSPNLSTTITLSANRLSINAISSSNLPLFAYNSTNNVCEYSGGYITTKSTGRCVIAFSQEGNSEFKPANNFLLEFNIVGTAIKTTITCIKGKLTKKVTALKPVCPSGYKKK